MKFKKLILAVALTGVFTLAACNSNPNPDSGNNGGNGTQDTVKLEGIKIQAEGNVTKLSVGKTLKLTAVPTPASASANVNWSSSNQEVATISQDGTVSALKPGLTVIKAVSKSDDKIKAEYSLTIEKAAAVNPTGITLSTQDNIKEVEVGKSLKINATVTPENADQSVRFLSSDTTVATVTNAGIVKGLKAGKVTITVTSTKVNTVTKTIEITVKPSSFVPDASWNDLEFSNHDSFINAEKDTKLKVKGTVTLKTAGKNNTTNYFLQNGNEGFYITSQEATLGNVEVGSSYAVGGVKEFKSGCNAISQIGYFEALTETLPVNTIDISDSTNLTYDGQKQNMGAKDKVNELVISSFPTSYSKAYSIRVKKAETETDLRVDPALLGKEAFDELTTVFKNACAGQVVNVEGIMTSFGYSSPASQIAITKVSDVVIKPLDDAAKVKLAVEEVFLPFSIEKDVNTITLPTEVSKFSEVKLSWLSASELISVVDGKVTHSEHDTLVKLTVTASLNGKTATKEFVVNVFSKDENNLTEVAKLDFEDAQAADKNGCSGTKPGYKDGEVTLGGHQWALNNALIGGDDRDRRNGNFAARIQIKNADNSIVLLEALEFNTLEFVAAIYGENLLGPVLEVSYAVGDSKEFTKLETTYEINDYSKHKIRVKLPVEAGSKVRVKITALSGHGQRVNIDDIRLLLAA